MHENRVCSLFSAFLHMLRTPSPTMGTRHMTTTVATCRQEQRAHIFLLCTDATSSKWGGYNPPPSIAHTLPTDAVVDYAYTAWQRRVDRDSRHKGAPTHFCFFFVLMWQLANREDILPFHCTYPTYRHTTRATHWDSVHKGMPSVYIFFLLTQLAGYNYPFPLSIYGCHRWLPRCDDDV
jgi:hypothetical protein